MVGFRFGLALAKARRRKNGFGSLLRCFTDCLALFAFFYLFRVCLNQLYTQPIVILKAT